MSILKVFLPVPILLLCLLISSVHAEMSSTNFRITTTVMSGGGNTMSSASFALVSTLGQPSPIGSASSDSYYNDLGFWHTLLMISVGDINSDGVVDLQDVITALQIVTGQTPASIMLEADVDGDGYIGIPEALMILRQFGGL